MRQPAAGQRLAREQLPDRQPAALERVRRAREVDAPDAELLLADLRARGVGVRLEAVEPAPQRLRVVLAQRLGIDELEPGAREAVDHRRDMRELAAREHVLLDEIADAAAEARRAQDVERDPVVQHEAARASARR